MFDGALTHGHLERQRFVPTWGWPPWRRGYGFRTDERVKPLLEEIVAPTPVLPVPKAMRSVHAWFAAVALGIGSPQLLPPFLVEIH